MVPGEVGKDVSAWQNISSNPNPQVQQPAEAETGVSDIWSSSMHCCTTRHGLRGLRVEPHTTLLGRLLALTQRCDADAV